MKNVKILFSVLLVCILVLTGCGKKDNKKENNKNNNNSQTAGDAIDIKLDANSSTGYEWTYELTGDDAIVLANRYEEDKDCEGLDGCGGYEIFTVTATHPGHINLKLIYSRPWEENGDKLEANYDITIDGKLNITETHTGSYFEK